MAEKTSATKGKTVSYWLNGSDAELVEKAAKAYGISRSTLIATLIEDSRDVLEDAIAEKPNSLLVET